MARAKRSVIWKISYDQLVKVVSESKTFTEVLLYFGLSNKGGNFKTLKSRFQNDGIDFSHFTGSSGKTKEMNIKRKKLLNEILVRNSTYSRYHLKARLLKEELLKNECSICKLEPFWKGKELKLVLDHINGEFQDNRIENLRLVCPNCNSQLETFAGRKLKKINNCKKCFSVINNSSTYCIICANRMKKRKRKVERPPRATLLKEIKELGYAGTGRKYGVSDNAVRKWGC